MIFNYATFLSDSEDEIKAHIQHFISTYDYKEVNSFKGMSVCEFINRGNEIILSDAPTTVGIKFYHERDRVEITIDHTVKAFTEIFCNENRLIRMVGDIIKKQRFDLISFDLGSDGVVSQW